MLLPILFFLVPKVVLVLEPSTSWLTNQSKMITSEWWYGTLQSRMGFSMVEAVGMQVLHQVPKRHISTAWAAFGMSCDWIARCPVCIQIFLKEIAFRAIWLSIILLQFQLIVSTNCCYNSMAYVIFSWIVLTINCI